MTEKLKTLRSQKYIGAVELADEAARLIGRFVPRQERGSVSEVPDERMVRYYTTEGLISPPEGKQGSSAVYGYLHLLQMLVIKRLQAEHLPIKKIKELVEGKSAGALEQLLNVGEKSTDERPKNSTAKNSTAKNSAAEYLQSLLKPSKARAHSAPLSLQASAPLSQSLSISTSAWARVEIEPGLEVHIRNDYHLSDDVKERQRLARRILSEIETHGLAQRK